VKARHGAGDDAIVTPIVDPYTSVIKTLPMAATITLPSAMPRGIAAAEDGTLYLADTLKPPHLARQSARSRAGLLG
jgi:hypothetical protein